MIWLAMAAQAAVSAGVPVSSLPARPSIAAPSPVILAAGTAVQMKTKSALDSRSIRQGQRFELIVTNDVLSGGRVVIPAGTSAVGEVLSLSEKGMFGKGAKFALQPLFIEFHGERINLAGRTDELGDKQVTAAAITTVLTPFGLFITGKSASLPAGSPLNATVRTDTPIRP